METSGESGSEEQLDILGRLRIMNKRLDKKWQEEPTERSRLKHETRTNKSGPFYRQHSIGPGATTPSRLPRLRVRGGGLRGSVLQTRI